MNVIIKKLGYQATQTVLFIFLLVFSGFAYAATPVVDLHIGYKTVNFSGKSRQALAINDQIPGPVLRFKEGDQVTIRVYNHLKEGTSIHWHGLILPWRMDGVEHVTQEPIPPGGMFQYQFTLKQSGTYWYHAHAGLQEQEGLYGAFIIDPPKERWHYNQDFPVVLSDWSNTPAARILANLHKEGDYYSTRFPLQATLSKFIHDYRKGNAQQRQELKDAYQMMQQMRMSIYDLSDVAYDAFLMNGHNAKNPWRARVKIGDRVRLRFVGAGGSTFFNVKLVSTIEGKATTQKIRVIHVQGNDITPYETDHLLIAPGETYDVLVPITHAAPYMIYAESLDTSGAALGALVTQPDQAVDFSSVPPFPEPGPQSTMGGMHAGHGGMSHDQMAGMSHEGHESGNSDGLSMPAVPTKYDRIRAIEKTNNPDLPVETIQMVLNGWMGRYIWFLNGEPEYKAKPIIIEPGKRYRFIFRNDTMMHHPMHLHGHWFLLRNGHGAFDPKLHTIDVPPGATVTVDFDADTQDGYWYFHCHNLFHMMSGMARVVAYPPDAEASRVKIHDHLGTPSYAKAHPQSVRKEGSETFVPGTAHAPGWYLANFWEMGAAVNQPNSARATLKTLIGSDYNKLQFLMKDAEMVDNKVESADVDIFYWRVLDEFWSFKGGANYTYRPALTPYWQPGIGIEGLAPYFIETDARIYYHDGAAKLDLELGRDFAILPKFFIHTSVRGLLATQTVDSDEVGSGLNFLEFIVRPYYQLTPYLALYAEWNYTQNFGVTKNLMIEDNEPTRENLFNLGISVLF